MKIERVTPPMALPGGWLRVELEGAPEGPLRVEVGESAAELIAASRTCLTVRVPEKGGEELRVFGNGEVARAPLRIGQVVASELHCVANPAVDSLGNVYVTYSGTRGEHVPVSVFVVYPDGRKNPFLGDLVNPTAMAVGPDNCLYISSRHSGTVYRCTFDRELEKYVDGLGLATGLAFDSQGNLLVGDRGGAIYRITPERELTVLCELEPSVSAYHLLVDPEDHLFVTGPTLSTQDCVYRISPQGEVRVFFKGLGRPQGLALDPQGRLQVAASYRGRKGLFTIRDGVAEWSVSGPMLVGVAYSPDYKTLYLADNGSLYRLSL